MTKPDVEKDGLDPGAGDTPDVNVTVNSGAGSGDQQTSITTSPGASGSFEFTTRGIPLAERERWFKTYWRPAAAWIYLLINLFDFVVAPVITMILPKLIGAPYVPWNPLTLSNGGMFHLAFGAIIGVTAWGRTRERVMGVGSADAG
jgi:hypothetical protein